MKIACNEYRYFLNWMQNMSKFSIRFFNDREVRAVWDDATNGWLFTVLDVVGVLNNRE